MPEMIRYDFAKNYRTFVKNYGIPDVRNCRLRLLQLYNRQETKVDLRMTTTVILTADTKFKQRLYV